LICAVAPLLLLTVKRWVNDEPMTERLFLYILLSCFRLIPGK